MPALHSSVSLCQAQMKLPHEMQKKRRAREDRVHVYIYLPLRSVYSHITDRTSDEAREGEGG